MIRLSLFASALLSVIAFAGALSAVEVGQEAPDFEFKKTWNLPDEFKSIKDLEGKVAMVEVWATW